MVAKAAASARRVAMGGFMKSAPRIAMRGLARGRLWAGLTSLGAGSKAKTGRFCGEVCGSVAGTKSLLASPI
jgi:hypothetical protein